MLGRAKKLVVEHKQELIFATATVAAVAVGSFVGYKVGIKRTQRHVLNVCEEHLPELVKRSGFLGFANTMELIEDTVPEAYDMVVAHFGDCRSAVTKAAAHRFFNDPEVKEAMQILKEVCK